MSLSRQLGIQYRTCWHMLHRLRAMLASGVKLPLTGIVEADETHVGGKVENRPLSAPKPGKRARGTNKPMLFAAAQRRGEARTLAVPPASGAAIAPALWDWTGGAATLMTDAREWLRHFAELGTHRWIGRKMEAHHRVTHSKGKYASEIASDLRGTTESGLRAHVNTAEPRKSLRDLTGFFGLLKRGIAAKPAGFARGIHHQISAKHLHRYTSEHEFPAANAARFGDNTKHDAAGRIAKCLIGQHGRLRLRELFA